MQRRTIYYGVILALLLVLLRAAEYHYLIYEIPTEYYAGILALIFTALGIWVGRKLAHLDVLPTVALHRYLPLLSAQELPRNDAPALSARELQVLDLIAKGHSNQEIADSLFLSLNTIKKHISTLFKKLEVKRRTQAIEKAKRLGLM